MNVDTGQRKQEKKKEKIPKIVATFVYASSQGQRTHSARTNCLIKMQLPFWFIGALIY
jgi:hypothetical protein